MRQFEKHIHSCQTAQENYQRLQKVTGQYHGMVCGNAGKAEIGSKENESFGKKEEQEINQFCNIA